MRKVVLTGKKMKLWMVVVLTLSFGNVLGQTTGQTLTLTLDRALEIALADNPTIKVAEDDIQLKKVADREAWQNLLPEASIGGTWQHTIQAAQMKLDTMTFKMGRDKTNTVAGVLTVSLPLFAPTVYGMMAISKTDIQLAVEKSRASKQDLVNQVTKAFYSLMLAQDSYGVMQDSYKLAEDNFKVVNAKFEHGAVSEYDKISAEVQMRSVKPNVIAAANALRLAQLQLKVLMGVTAEVELKIDDNLADHETDLFVNQLTDIREGLANNSALRQLDLNRMLLKKGLKVSKLAFAPTLGAQFTYQYQSLYNNSWNVFDYSWAGSSSLIFNLSIPLYKASNFTAIKTARIQLRQLDQTRIDTERKLNTQAETYRSNMASSSEQVASNKENIVQARKAVEIATKRYDVGAGTVLELNSSQVSLTQAQLVYCQSIYDYLSAKADLEQVLGRDR